MSIGRGEYDATCEAVMLATDAQGAVVIICGGLLGHGFSVSFKQEAVVQDAMDKLPAILRDVANQIETDLKQLRKS